MKILHLLYESKGDSFGIGGVGIRAYEIYRYLTDRHEITLLCKKYPGARDAEIDGLPHIFVGAESRSLTITLLSYAFHSARFVKKYQKEFDVIVEEFSPAVPTFLHIFCRRPCILQIQGYTGTLYFKKYNPVYAAVLYSLERIRPHFYNYFICVSADTLNNLSIDREGHEIEIIPNGISAELLAEVPRVGDYILYLGRIDIYGKGLDILIKAYSDLFRSYPTIKLVIAGDGRDRERFRSELTRLPDDVKKNIELLGWVSGDAKKEVLRNAMFVVLPSRHEVQGITALEAMAYGKPLVVSDIPELSYVEESGAGISFMTGDPVKLAQAMRTILLSNDREFMGHKGRQFVRNFTWDRIALQYEKYLQECAGKYGR